MLRNKILQIAVITFILNLLAHSSFCGVARAETGLVPLQKEPDRFAFVVGNGRYALTGSNLPDLSDTCNEAVQFRKVLIDIGISENHIFPAVGPLEAGEQPEAAVRKSICDLTNNQLQKSLRSYINMLLNESNPYGIVYYAGHGAQSDDEFYAFGVDAQVDVDLELDRLLTYPNYEVFSHTADPADDGVTAVNVTRTISDINGPRGKALLVILDACRDDPIMQEFGRKVFVKQNHQIQVGTKSIKPADFTPEELRRFTVGFLNSPPQKYDEMFRNIMVVFASQPGKPAESVNQGANWFSSNLFRYLRDQSVLNIGIPALVSDFKARARRWQGGRPQSGRQIPQSIGQMERTPVYCLKGCPQPIADFSTENVEIIPEEANGENGAIELQDRQRIGASFARLPQETRSLAERQPFISFVDYPQVPGLVVVAQLKMDPKQKKLNPLNLDVFYCSGDSGEPDRKSAAQEFAKSIRQQHPSSQAMGETYLGQVRLRSLDVNDNLAMKRPKQGNSLVLPKSSPASQKWQDELSSSFDKSYKDDVTKGYIRAYFCKGFSITQAPRPLVYTQVALQSEVATAKKYLTSVAGTLPQFRFVDEIEPVDETHPGKSHAPNVTDVRFSSADQRSNAEAIAAALRQQIATPVKVIKIRGAGEKAKRNPVIEIWFGRSEMSNWPGHAVLQ